MKYKKWIRYWILIISIVPILGMFNYFIDIYGLNNILTVEEINAKKFMNVKFTTRIKAKALSSGEFDTIMLGTSRIGVMNPDVINRYLNANTYNLSYPASITKIHKELFFYAIKFNKVKNLIYGIDFMAFNKSRLIEQDFNEYYTLQKHILNKEEILNIDLYLNLDTFLKSIKLIQNNVRKTQKDVPRYVYKNGMRDYANYKEELAMNRYNFQKNSKIQINAYFKKNGFYKDYIFSQEYFNDFKEILTYCKNNGIKVWVYIPPFHKEYLKKLYSTNLSYSFEIFQRKLAQIVEFTDFTIYKEITDDENNYWDVSHLKSQMTDKIITHVLNKEVNITKLRINKYNVEKHLKEIKIFTKTR